MKGQVATAIVRILAATKPTTTHICATFSTLLNLDHVKQDALVRAMRWMFACTYGEAAGRAGGDDLLVAVASGLIVGAAGDIGGDCNNDAINIDYIVPKHVS